MISAANAALFAVSVSLIIPYPAPEFTNPIPPSPSRPPAKLVPLFVSLSPWRTEAATVVFSTKRHQAEISRESKAGAQQDDK
ncbi:hypothetical protein SODALDRAFT_359782 [Sodiomyces alkalinus F11]|uniref:Uncharacterized protein n=1 Tax=Sodiomyces alkalinus (strain CBS 110278 / VKM F-3762 / F11) TaxID=1314773 RepID=A0A3N2PWB6_SODAK|nr:hypothetical protein SODALDRAFT_359782 [Sodiomyces alkalinus F11]ROT38676.1 hypothetical protein SODALDRAFT_359782 [Sodiomyces alkalinus F11]